MSEGNIVTVNLVQQRILIIRGQRVILDADLARLYGVTTKRLNQQVNPPIHMPARRDTDVGTGRAAISGNLCRFCGPDFAAC